MINHNPTQNHQKTKQAIKLQHLMPVRMPRDQYSGLGLVAMCRCHLNREPGLFDLDFHMDIATSFLPGVCHTMAFYEEFVYLAFYMFCYGFIVAPYWVRSFPHVFRTTASHSKPEPSVAARRRRAGVTSKERPWWIKRVSLIFKK